MTRPAPRIWLKVALVAATVVVAAPIATRVIRNLTFTRGAMGTLSRLIVQANAGDLVGVGGLCSARYRRDHPPEAARGGGVVGLPRQVHPNFRAWVEGDEVRVCPGNRVGTVYRFLRRDGAWKFDGPIGFLRADGSVTPITPAGISSREKP